MNFPAAAADKTTPASFDDDSAQFINIIWRTFSRARSVSGRKKSGSQKLIAAAEESKNRKEKSEQEPGSSSKVGSLIGATAGAR